MVLDTLFWVENNPHWRLAMFFDEVPYQIIQEYTIQGTAIFAIVRRELLNIKPMT